MVQAPSRPVRILAFWGQGWSLQFERCFRPGFLENPAYEVELVSGDRKVRSDHVATLSRLLDLRRRLIAGEFDLIVCGINEEDAWPLNRRLPARCKILLRYLFCRRRSLDTFWAPILLRDKRIKTPMAAIDYRDESFVAPSEFLLLESSTLFFKSNLYHWPHRSIAPLSAFLGYGRVQRLRSRLRPSCFYVPITSQPEKVTPIRERDIDILFTGVIRPWASKGDQEILPVRQFIYEQCLRLKAEGRYNVVCIDGKVSMEEYESLLQRSKLVACAESVACETSRHYDAPLFGAVPLANWPYADCWKPFLPDEHAIFFSVYGSDFDRAVDRALADLDRLQVVADQARAFTLRYKFPKAIADYVVTETLRQHAETQAAREANSPSATAGSGR